MIVGQRDLIITKSCSLGVPANNGPHLREMSVVENLTACLHNKCLSRVFQSSDGTDTFLLNNPAACEPDFTVLFSSRLSDWITMCLQ